jgi:dynein heavy chain
MVLFQNPRYKVEDEKLKMITNAFSLTNQLVSHIETAENKLKNDRLEIENSLIAEKNGFSNLLNELKSEIDKLKESSITTQHSQNNVKIKGLNDKLKGLIESMEKINDQETDLDLGVTEYPLIAESQVLLKPFEELWKLIADHETKETSWKKIPLKQLNPEEVQKEHKEMMQKAKKLQVQFQTLKFAKPEGLANKIFTSCNVFKQYIPIIEYLCNEGLQQRHAEKIKDVIGVEFDENTRLHSLMSLNIEQYKDQLEEISDSATKEYSI